MDAEVGWLPAFDLLSATTQDRGMAAIWSESASIRGWLGVESELAGAQADTGVIDSGDAELIRAACAGLEVDRERLWSETRLVGYPILPLITQLTEALPDGAAGRVHYGATTQDIMDTALAIQLQLACTHLERTLLRLGDAIAVLVLEHGSTVMAARTHAQQAVPTTFGAKMAVFLDQVSAELEIIREVRRSVSVVSLFGAGGTSAALGGDSTLVRRALARRLGLADVRVPWHVARGNVTRFGLSLATMSAVCTRFAREIIDLSRTEIAEVRERSGHHRGASSTMPQKANPISCESIVGLAVTAGSVATSLIRAMESGHERSSGEWQVEWFSLPTASVLAASALDIAAETAESLQVFPEAMVRSLAADNGLVMSEAAMMRLAPVIGRDRAHELVYRAAVRTRTDGTTLADELRADLPVEHEGLVAELEAGSYLGEAAEICAAALDDWNRFTTLIRT